MTTSPPTSFTHLHVHSHYTLLGATPAVEELVARAVADGMPASALTDRNALYGVVAHHRACQRAGIQAITGMTLSLAPPAALPLASQVAPAQVVLLATGPAGYRSLCALSGWLQGHPRREERQRQGLPWAQLEQNNAGLLCLDGGWAGWAMRLLQAGQARAARQTLSRLAALFPGRFYLSLERHPGVEEPAAEALRHLGQRLGLPLVAVQPVYCLDPAGRELLPLLAAIDHNCRLDEVPASVLPGRGQPAIDLHWLSPAEVASRFAGLPQALAQAGEIARRCQPALPDGRPLWPGLDLPQGQSPDDALAELASRGYRQRYGTGHTAGLPRLQAELEAIARHGFAPLFLIVADVVRFARRAGVPLSTRGSVANSLVAYCAGISAVDPLAHNLLFARFLNPARRSLPDIDLDFCSRRRDEVLAYVRQRYGPERVALVATVSTLKQKSAVREAAKALGWEEEAIGRLVGQLPSGWHPDPRRRERRTLADLAAQSDDAATRQVLALASRLEGQPHHLSVHPGGVVIAPGEMSQVAPVQWAPKGFLITQFDYRDVAAIGLPKLDLLGIRALTVLADAAALVRQHYEPGFDLEAIPDADPETSRMLAQGETIGVFQCESSGARRTLRQLQAGSIQDLAVANAFFKPGPALGGMAEAFVRRYRGEAGVAYLHAALAPILGQTRGVILFQEQILRLATEVAGLSWAQADRLRQGMSKFDQAAMAELQRQFEEGCQARSGFTPGQARQLWQQVIPFAGYGFNQGHATAYAVVSYRSAYLKAHWPAAFLCARLANYGGFHHPAVYMAEAQRLGIAVRPPHINHSGRRFTLGFAGAQPVLWMGLGQVRDLRRRAIEGIVAGRPFAGLEDLLARVRLQRKELAHLVQCGGLDGLGESRAALLARAGQGGRAGSLRQMAFSFVAEETAQESAAQRLAWERQVLGWPVSLNPLALAPGIEQGTVALEALPASGGRPVTVAGVRLPGWTGSKGFHLWDGKRLVLARNEGSGARVPTWQPLRLEGRWQPDGWGGGVLLVGRVDVAGPL